MEAEANPPPIRIPHGQSHGPPSQHVSGPYRLILPISVGPTDDLVAEGPMVSDQPTMVAERAAGRQRALGRSEGGNAVEQVIGEADRFDTV